MTVFVKLRCSAGVGKGWADGLGAVLFLLWKVGVLRGVAQRTSELRPWPPLGSQHWVRADGSSKEKQAGGASRERHPLGLGYCVKESTSSHLPGVPAPPSFSALPAHLAVLLLGPRSHAKQDGAFPGNMLRPLQLSSSEVRADSTLSSLDDLA